MTIRMTCHGRLGQLLLAACLAGSFCTGAMAQSPPAPPAPPANVQASDFPHDDGTKILVTFPLSVDDVRREGSTVGLTYIVERSGEQNGAFEEAARVTTSTEEIRAGRVEAVVEKCVPGEEYWFRVAATDVGRGQSAFIATTAPASGSRQLLDGTRMWLATITLVVCGAVVLFIILGRMGMKLKIRPIAGLEALNEAVGRATEMGRSTLYIAGIQDMNDMQTIAGLTILSSVSQKNAEYDTPLEIPTTRSLVMTAARETVETSYLVAGRPDAYNPDKIYYVSDEQFAFVSYVTGHMVRERPAACFYFGAFYAESLILAETGNSIGAIQVSGTAESSQLPFLVAACDYVLIGEEFFAASAYLSGNPDQLGSLKGQDVGKLIVLVLIFVGSTLFTLANLTEAEQFARAGDYLRDTVLSSGG